MISFQTVFWIITRLFAVLMVGNEVSWDNYWNIQSQMYKEALMEPTDIINMHHYPSETHVLNTTDDYILVLHRIPHGKQSNIIGKPILLLHGINSASTAWIINEKNSLGYILSDEGYDVWLANFRGNEYSAHKKYRMKDKEFWNYSVDELIEYDMPAIIDYVLEETGYTKVLLVGHSLGSTASLGVLITHPTYNKKVSGIIAMAPGASCKYTSSVLISPKLTFWKIVMDYIEYFGIHRLTHTSILDLYLYRHFCTLTNFTPCNLPVYAAIGYNPYLKNKTRDLVYLYHEGRGTSVKTARHIIQVCRGKTFSKKYDYGPDENIRRYNNPHPPEYTTENVTVPVVIVYAANDAVTTPLDITILARQMKNLVDVVLVDHPMAAHYDLIWNTDRSLVADRIIDYMRDLWASTDFLA